MAFWANSILESRIGHTVLFPAVDESIRNFSWLKFQTTAFQSHVPTGDYSYQSEVGGGRAGGVLTTSSISDNEPTNL